MARYSNIVFLWLFSSFSLYSQSEQYHIEHLTPQDGLSHGCAGTPMQDSKGFLWIPTLVGLDRYDGYTIREYTAHPRDPHSISSNNVAFIYEDPADSGKILWIGTYSGGLNKFNRETEQFTHFQHDPDDTTSLSEEEAHCIYKISPGHCLIGTTGTGLNLFDRPTAPSKDQHDPHNPGSLSYDRIRYISSDHWGNIWIATDKGLNRLSPVRWCGQRCGRSLE
jgi:ligand-binding sensor domain-containing protein